MKKLKPGQLCTIDKHKYKVIESDGLCFSCSFYKKNEFTNGCVLCIHTISNSCCFKLIK